jgi:hypothetical protein
MQMHGELRDTKCDHGVWVSLRLDMALLPSGDLVLFFGLFNDLFLPMNEWLYLPSFSITIRALQLRDRLL